MLWTGVVKLTLFAAIALSQSSAHNPAPVPQREFSADDAEVQHPATLPDSILNVLAHDQVIEELDGRPQPSGSVFSAEKLRSPSPGTQLYMVMGVGPLKGANVSPFWLIRENSRTHQAAILWSSGALNVSLHYRSGSSYPEITSGSVTMQHANVFTYRYRSDKEKYLRTRSGKRL